MSIVSKGGFLDVYQVVFTDHKRRSAIRKVHTNFLQEA
jgi:hypothetical protein